MTPTTGSAATGSTSPARSPCATAGSSTPSASGEPTPEPASSSWSKTSTSASSTRPPANPSASWSSTQHSATKAPDAPPPGNPGIELAEVDLGLRAGLMGLRDAHLNLHQVELDPAAGHVPGHGHLRQCGAVLGHQPLPHPPGGVPLLSMRVLVRNQPSVDHTGPRVGRRPGPRYVLLTRWRQRRRQRLSHRPPVDPMSLGQLPNRQGLNAAVAPDLLEQLHS